MEEVIHVETQEEWDIVTEHYKLKWSGKFYFDDYKKNNNACINTTKK